MHAKVIDPNRHGKIVYQNSGSSQRCVNYLAKEAKAVGEPVVFFSSEPKGELSAEQVVQQLDGNRKGLRQQDDKFHSLVLSPSAEEVAAMGNDPAALRRYTRNVMELYAQNFQLKDGRQLHESDLVWAATVHQQRAHHGQDAPGSGTPKAGLQTHVHVIVSARDAAQKSTLNPLGKATRFNRVEFQAQATVQLEDELGYRPAPGLRTPSRRERVQAKAQDIRQKAAESPRARKPLTPEQQQKKEERLATQVARVNTKLALEHQLDPERVKEIGRQRAFDNGFYGNLGALERRAERGTYTPDPYDYLAIGRLAGRTIDERELGARPALGRAYSPPPARAERPLLSGMEHSVRQLVRSLTPASRTQDVRSEEEKRRDQVQRHDYEPER